MAYVRIVRTSSRRPPFRSCITTITARRSSTAARTRAEADSRTATRRIAPHQDRDQLPSLSSVSAPSLRPPAHVGHHPTTRRKPVTQIGPSSQIRHRRSPASQDVLPLGTREKANQVAVEVTDTRTDQLLRSNRHPHHQPSLYAATSRDTVFEELTTAQTSNPGQ